jgi:hypothetical protein
MKLNIPQPLVVREQFFEGEGHGSNGIVGAQKKWSGSDRNAGSVNFFGRVGNASFCEHVGKRNKHGDRIGGWTDNQAVKKFGKLKVFEDRIYGAV